MAVVLSAGTKAATSAVAAPAHAHGGPDSDDVTRLLAEDAWYPEVQDSRQLASPVIIAGEGLSAPTYLEVHDGLVYAEFPEGVRVVAPQGSSVSIGEVTLADSSRG